MRKLLSIFFCVICGLSYAQAQYIWVSQDNNSHYVDIEYGTNVSDPIVLTSAHQPALSYVTMLVDMYRDKIDSGEWSVWVESYVHTDDNTTIENRQAAKKLSNTIKSYFIASKILTEKNFTTRNYSGTLSGRDGITTIVIGMRYPLERILPEQLIDWDYNDLVWLTEMAVGDSLVKVNFDQVSSVIPGMDTTKIYSPYFEPITFSYKALAIAPKADTVTFSKTKELDLAPSTMAQPSHTLELDRRDSIALGTMPFMAANLTVKGKKGAKSSKSKVEKVARNKQDKAQRVKTRGGTVLVGATTDATAAAAIVAPIVGGSKPKPKPKNIEFGFVNEQVAQAELDDLQYRQGNVAERDQNKNKESVKDDKVALKTYSEGIADPLSLNIPSLTLPTVAPAAVSANEVSILPSLYDVKGRLIRPKKSGATPKVTYDSQGNAVLDATAFERAMSAENLSVIEAENRTIRIAEQRAVRERQSTDRRQVFKSVQQAKGRFAVFGVGLNALTTLALTPSIQFDAYFSNRFQASVEWYYSRWNYIQDYKLNINMFSPELRFYPMGRIKEFSGLYVGIYGVMGAYNFRWDSRQGRQSDYWGVGVSAGYVLPLGKRGFYLEAGISAGYLDEKIDSYFYHQGENFFTDSYRQVSPFFPTKIKVSFIYRIFNKKIDRGEEL